MPDIIRAPFTPEQVDALNRFQRADGMHPFTCGELHVPGAPILIARADGWHCSDPYGEECGYTQDWALAVMANPDAWPKPFWPANVHPTSEPYAHQQPGAGFASSTSGPDLADWDSPEDASYDDRDGLRERYAEAMWKSAEEVIIAEWICCEPLNPKHGLCAKGYAALGMIRALIVDDPAAWRPAPLTTAVLAVRDAEVERLRARGDTALDGVAAAGEMFRAQRDRANAADANSPGSASGSPGSPSPATTNSATATGKPSATSPTSSTPPRPAPTPSRSPRDRAAPTPAPVLRRRPGVRQVRARRRAHRLPGPRAVRPQPRRPGARDRTQRAAAPDVRTVRVRLG